MTERKKTVALDFDGVVNLYVNGWEGAKIVQDEPVESTLEFLVEAVDEFDIAIFSSRSHVPGGIDAMRSALHMWLLNYRCGQYGYLSEKDAERIVGKVSFPLHKPPAHLTFDDRAIQFNGTWPSFEEIHAFKPWNKR